MMKNKCPDCGDHHEPAPGRCDRHEGWTNLETWSVALHIDNDAVALARFVRIARDYETQPIMAGVPTTLAEAFSRVVDGWLDDSIKGGASTKDYVSAALARAALARVDWRDLAQHYIRKARESAAVRA